MRPTEILIPSPVAEMYAVALALDAAADHPIARDEYAGLTPRTGRKG